MDGRILDKGGIFILFLALLVSGCGSKAEQAAVAPAAKEKKTKTLKVNIDIEEQQKMQAAADMGYKSWKNSVIDVAEECIINHGIGASTGECEILSEDAKNAVVRVKTRKEGSFKVRLERLVKPDGIWTATEVEKEG